MEEELDGDFVMQNQEGATGAVATQYVYDQDPDGYDLLFGAENANLYQVLDVSERDYLNDFEPLTIIGQGLAVIVVEEDSEFESMEDLVEYAQDHPGELNMGTTGEGGLPHVVGSMLTAVLDTEFNEVPYNGEGPLFPALLGGEIDFTAVGVAAAQEYVEAGDARILSVVNDEEVEEVEGATPLSEIYPEFDQYLPWGPFYGVFAHEDTPDEITDRLSEAFANAQDDEEFQDLLRSLGTEPLNIHGEEAVEYVRHNQSTAAWLLYEAGGVEHSPEEFDIPRIDDIEESE